MLTIRPMQLTDAKAFSAAFAAQGWEKPTAQFTRYAARQAAGEIETFVAELDGQPVGYCLLLPEDHHGPFAGTGIPCIQDFNVLIPYQRRGIGTAILDAAEAAAACRCDRVCLGVGLNSGYGPAQRLYVRRGYVPDGSGVWDHNQPAAEYAMVENGDDLVLYLCKTLSSQC